MGDILVKCPSTHGPVPTGLKAEWVVLESLPSIAIPFTCAACGLVHTWKREEAWIGYAPRVTGEGIAERPAARRVRTG